MRDLFMPANSFESKKAKIKVVGVGGGGGNAINHMVASGLKDVDFIAVNTDAQDLRRNQAPYLVQVGEKITKGWVSAEIRNAANARRKNPKKN